MAAVPLSRGRKLEYGVRREYSVDHLKSGPVSRLKNRPWCSCGWSGGLYLNNRYGPDMVIAHLEEAHGVKTDLPYTWRKVLEFYGTVVIPR